MRTHANTGWLAGVPLALAFGIASACGGTTESGVGGESHFQCGSDADCREHDPDLVCSPSRNRCVTEAELSSELAQDGGAGAMNSGAGNNGAAGNNGSMACVPGEVRTCPCPSGQSGSQTCQADGSGFTSCRCVAGTGGLLPDAGNGETPGSRTNTDDDWLGANDLPFCIGGECDCEGECCPADDACYADGPDGVGDECLAMRDNSLDGPNGTALGGVGRVQMRSVWGRQVAPAGLENPVVYSVLYPQAALPRPECNEGHGIAGWIQLLDFDMTAVDPEMHRLRRGFAPLVSEGDVASAIQDGLCMVEGAFSDTAGPGPLPEDQLGPSEDYPEGLPKPMAQPWDVGPSVARRVIEDFDLASDREQLLEFISADTSIDGVVYVDEEQGVSHSYFPLTWDVVYSPDGGVELATPIREAETWTVQNDPDERSCVGAYQAGHMDPASGCRPGSAPGGAAWGCVDGSCADGEAPSRTTGYVLITELEQAYSTRLGQTLCQVYPGNFEGPTCRDDPGWDPAAGHDGLPDGDWCAATNSPATEDCHDAYRTMTYFAYQGFNVAEAACAFE